MPSFFEADKCLIQVNESKSKRKLRLSANKRCFTLSMKPTNFVHRQRV